MVTSFVMALGQGQHAKWRNQSHLGPCRHSSQWRNMLLLSHARPPRAWRWIGQPATFNLCGARVAAQLHAPPVVVVCEV